MTSDDYTLACRLLISCHHAHDGLTDAERQAAFDNCKAIVRELALAWGVAVDW